MLKHQQNLFLLEFEFYILIKEFFLNNLYKRTPLQTTFSVNAVALVDGVPRQLNLKGMIDSYIDHQLEVVRRRSQHRLDKAHAEAHINEGLIKALDHIDEIIDKVWMCLDLTAKSIK